MLKRKLRFHAVAEIRADEKGVKEYEAQLTRLRQREADYRIRLKRNLQFVRRLIIIINLDLIYCSRVSLIFMPAHLPSHAFTFVIICLMQAEKFDKEIGPFENKCVMRNVDQEE